MSNRLASPLPFLERECTVRGLRPFLHAWVLAWAIVSFSCSDGTHGSGKRDSREPIRGSADSQETSKQGPPPTKETTESNGTKNADVRLVQVSRPLMGTVFEITVAGRPRSIAMPAIQDALNEIERLEDVLSEWRSESEISQINTNAGVSPVQVGEDTLAVVNAGLQVSAWSHGAFDMSWAALRGLYRFQRGEHYVPGPQDLRPRLRLINYRNIQVRDRAQTVFLTRKGMAIGTGGIGKGYALDRAAQILTEAGVDQFMLFGGGQVQVKGMRGERPWRVGIQHPRLSGHFAFLEATAGSISTSGDYEHFFIDDAGTRWHHILDLQTGLPARDTLSVTWVAPQGLYSDALSTACFVLGPARCLQMAARPELRDHAVLTVGANWQLSQTKNLSQRLHFRMPVTNGILQSGSVGPSGQGS